MRVRHLSDGTHGATEGLADLTEEIDEQDHG